MEFHPIKPRINLQLLLMSPLPLSDLKVLSPELSSELFRCPPSSIGLVPTSVTHNYSITIKESHSSLFFLFVRTCLSTQTDVLQYYHCLEVKPPKGKESPLYLRLPTTVTITISPPTFSNLPSSLV